MDIQAEKIELVKLLLEVDDPNILSEVKSVLQHSDSDFYDYLPDTVKLGIAAGLKDIEDGNVRDHEEVMQEFKAKYGSKS